jgi:hypothetical protein
LECETLFPEACPFPQIAHFLDIALFSLPCLYLKERPDAPPTPISFRNYTYVKQFTTGHPRLQGFWQEMVLVNISITASICAISFPSPNYKNFFLAIGAALTYTDTCEYLQEMG